MQLLNEIIPNDSFTHCLLHAEDAFRNLSLPWFLVFGTAFLMILISALNKYGFTVLRRYGQMDDGQGWTASYNGPCDKMPHKKCRTGYSEIKFETFKQ